MVSTYLVVLDRASAAEDVVTILEDVRSLDTSAYFTILVPADRLKAATDGECWAEAMERAIAAQERLRGLGFAVLDALAGDFMRRTAIGDELNRGEHTYAGVCLFTGPYRPGMDATRLIPAGIAQQLQRRHGLPVHHFDFGQPPTTQSLPAEDMLKRMHETPLSHHN